MALTVIRVKADRPEDDVRLDAVLAYALEGEDYTAVTDPADLRPFASGARLLFAVSCGAYGLNASYAALLGGGRPGQASPCTGITEVIGIVKDTKEKAK